MRIFIARDEPNISVFVDAQARVLSALAPKPKLFSKPGVEIPCKVEVGPDGATTWTPLELTPKPEAEIVAALRSALAQVKYGDKGHFWSAEEHRRNIVAQLEWALSQLEGRS
jgi:hypothetical protein